MNRTVPSFLLMLLVPALALTGENTGSRKSATSAPGSATTQAIVEHIKKMEVERVEAGVRKDIDAIAAVTADDYVQIDWNGQVLNKAATLARIKSSEIKLQSNAVEEMDVRVYGDTAVVIGLSTRKGTMNGKDISGAIRATRVYVNRNGRWQVVAFQQTRVAQN